MTFSLRALALAVVFAVFGAACGGSSSTDVAASGAADTATPADDTSAPATDGAGDGNDSGVDWDHDWTGDLIGGGQIDANSLAGQDTVLWFWAPW